MIKIESSVTKELPPAQPGERIDVLTFVVTRAGRSALKDQLHLQPNNRVRIISRLFCEGSLSGKTGMSIEPRQLKNNHAKLILYQTQRLAILGSFNLTRKSFGSNIESYVSVNNEYKTLAEIFDKYWHEAEARVEEVSREDVPEELASAVGGSDDEEYINEEFIDDADIDSDDESDQPDPGHELKLHDYQETIVSQVVSWLRGPKSDNRGRIVKLPTGAGKTLVAAEVIRNLLEQNSGARVLWVCHRVELVWQGYETCFNQLRRILPEKHWFLPEYIKKDEPYGRNKEEFIRSRNCQLVFCTSGMVHHATKRQEPFDLVVVDECHRFHPKTKRYSALNRYCSNRSIPRLGLTATPLASETRGFGRYWDTELMYGTNIDEKTLIRDGYLSRTNQQLSRCQKTGFTFHLGRNVRDLDAEILRRVHEFDRPEVNNAVKETWEEYRVQRKRILCFAVTCEHADRLKSQYFGNDDSVRILHSKLQRTDDQPTPKRAALEWFKATDEEPRMLISVLMLTEGVDLPKTDCLFLVRPTFSDDLVKQMMGRGLRGPESGGTEDCAFVDFTYQFVTADGRIMTQSTAVNNQSEELDDDDLDESDEDQDDNEYDAEDDTDESEDEQAELAVQISRGRLLDLRYYNSRQFEMIASLTNVASITLQQYCSRGEAFKNWKRNNQDKLEQIREILARSLKENRDAA